MVIKLLQHPHLCAICCKSVVTIFYFCFFDVIMPLTGVINHVFCINVHNNMLNICCVAGLISKVTDDVHVWRFFNSGV